MAGAVRDGWRGRLGLAGWLAPLAAGIFVFGLGEELWSRYLPEYLRFLGASALAVGAFGTLRDLLDAAYAYPGGWLSDRIGSRRALLLFGLLTTAGFVLYLASGSIAGIFLGILLVMAWKSLGLPATFALVGDELTGSRRIVGFTVQAILKRLPIVIAPPLGGVLIERLGMARGMRTGFVVSIALSVAMLVGLWMAFRGKRASASTPLAPASRSGKTRLHPTLKRLLIADCLIRLCEGLPDVFLVVWALEILHVSPSQFGLATSVLMGTAILSYLPAAALAERVEKKPFVIATFLFFTLFPLAVVFLVVWALEILHVSPSQFGLATSVLMGTAILSYLPAAALAERVEKKPFVIATFLFFTLFPLAVVFSRSFLHLLGAYVIGGLREVGEPARKALIVDFATLGARGKTVGLYYAIRGFTVAGAAAIGGALWTIRPALTFFAAAVLGVAGTLWAAVTLPARPALSKQVAS